MGQLAILLSVHTDNVKAICVPSDLEWYLILQCTACRETNDGEITVNMMNLSDIPGSRGEANLLMKCKFCKRDFSLSFDPKSLKNYTGSSTFQRIVELRCRGVDIVDWKLRGGFQVQSALSEQVWHDVDLSEGEWCEYDEKGGEPVALSEFQVKIEKV